MQSRWLAYTVRRQWKQYVGYLVVLIVALAVLLLYPDFAEEVDRFWTTLSTMFSIAAVGIAFFVWQAQSREQWRNQLPKKLSVVYYYLPNEKQPCVPVMACLDATLSHEGDIRAMAQQIGTQLVPPDDDTDETEHCDQEDKTIGDQTSQRKLSLLPQYRNPSPIVDYEDECLRYSVGMLMDRLPKDLVDIVDAGHGVVREPIDGRWPIRKQAEMQGYIGKLIEQGRIDGGIDVHD